MLIFALSEFKEMLSKMTKLELCCLFVGHIIGYSFMFFEHLEILKQMLKQSAENVFVIHGKKE